jgi:hypothetical protein
MFDRLADEELVGHWGPLHLFPVRLSCAQSGPRQVRRQACGCAAELERAPAVIIDRIDARNAVDPRDRRVVERCLRCVR